MMSPNLVITGTGRCGTGFYAKVLTTAGHPCTHEQYFTPNGPRQPTEATPFRHTSDSSWLAAPYLHPYSGPIVHAIRDPEAVVTSLLGINFFGTPGPYLRFARTWESEIHESSPAVAAWVWWIRWNTRIMPYADVVVDINGNWAEGLAWATEASEGSKVTARELRRAAHGVGQLNARERADLSVVYDGVPEELVTEAYDLWSELSSRT